MSKCLNFHSIINYQKDTNKIKNHFEKKINIEIIASEDNFPKENPNKSIAFNIYKEIINKEIINNYEKMLIMIIEKTEKTDLKIMKSKNYKKKIEIEKNEKNIYAFLETKKNVSKNIFCLKLLLKYYPFFCKNLYYYVNEVLYKNFNGNNERSIINTKSRTKDDDSCIRKSKKNFSNQGNLWKDDFFEEEKEHEFWEILEKTKYKGGIFNFEIDGDIKKLKNILLEEKTTEKNQNFIEDKNFRFGEDFDLKILKKFFESNEIELKWHFENDEIYFICNETSKRDSISFTFQIENEDIFLALKISGAKLIEKLFPSEIFEKLIKKFMDENTDKDYKEFFPKYKCKILETKFPEKKFINSKKKISFLENYDPKEKNLQEILIYIGLIYDTVIKFKIIEENDKQKVISFYIKNEEKNSYQIKISFEDKKWVVDFSILKFLELEFNNLFKWLLVMKYEII